MAHFWKMQAVSNDFVFLLHQDALAALAAMPAIAQRLCNRQTGIGADGLLTLHRPTSARPVVRMWNPDGSEDFCGNGTACAVHLCAQLGAGHFALTGQIASPVAGTIPYAIRDHIDGKAAVSINLGEPRLRAEGIPTTLPVPAGGVGMVPITVMDRTFTVTPLSTGSTHCVIFVDALPDDALFLHYSPAIEQHPAFPERTSVLWVVAGGDDALHMRIWERGVGETSGCGTGAAAATVAAMAIKGLAEPIIVASKGGTATVQWAADTGLWLTVDTHIIFEGEIPLG